MTTLTPAAGLTFGPLAPEDPRRLENCLRFREIFLASEGGAVELPAGAWLCMAPPKPDVEWHGWLGKAGTYHFIQRKGSRLDFSRNAPSHRTCLFSTPAGGYDPANPPAPLHLRITREEGAVAAAGGLMMGTAPPNENFVNDLAGQDREQFYTHVVVAEHLWGVGSLRLEGGEHEGGITTDLRGGCHHHDNFLLEVVGTRLVGARTVIETGDSKYPNRKGYHVRLRGVTFGEARMDRGGARNNRAYLNAAHSLEVDGLHLEGSAALDRAAALWHEPTDHQDWTDRYPTTKVHGATGTYHSAVYAGGGTARELDVRGFDVATPALVGQFLDGRLMMIGGRVAPPPGAASTELPGHGVDAYLQNVQVRDGRLVAVGVVHLAGDVVFEQRTYRSVVARTEAGGRLTGDVLVRVPDGAHFGGPLVQLQAGSRFTARVEGSAVFENGAFWAV